MQPHRPHLPPEVIDDILSLLRNDHSSLRCCSVVNKVFLDLAERHLYHQITLHDSGSDHETRINQLRAQLTASPCRISYVKILRISFATGGHGRSISPDETLVGDILHLFSNINTISLSGKISWVDLHMEFQESFAQMLVQNPIKSISITEIANFPLPLLDQCKRLVRLALVQLEDPSPIIEGSSVQPFHSNERAQITFLHIDYGLKDGYPIHPWLDSESSLQIQHLSSLRISVPYWIQTEPEPLQFLLDVSSSHLREVYLDINSLRFSVYETMEGEVISIPPTCELDLYELRSIKFLSISGNIKVIHCFDSDILITSIECFVDLLQTFGNPDPPITLEHITFEVSLLFELKDIGRVADVDWQPLATILTSGSFSSLRKVEMRVKYDFEAVESMTLISMLQSNDHLLPLIQSGLLSIIIEYPSRQPE